MKQTFSKPNINFQILSISVIDNINFTGSIPLKKQGKTHKYVKSCHFLLLLYFINKSKTKAKYKEVIPGRWKENGNLTVTLPHQKLDLIIRGHRMNATFCLQDDLTLLFISGMLNDGKSRVDAEYTQEKVTTLCALLNKTYQNLLKSDAMLKTGHHAPELNCSITEYNASHSLESVYNTSHQRIV